MNEILFAAGGIAVTVGQAAVALIGLALVLFALLWASARRAGRAAAEARDLDHRLADLGRLHAEMTGRMQTMAEVFGSRQSDLTRALTERLDGLTHRLGTSMTETTRSTAENLSKLNERIAVIDRAQRSITELSGQVVRLQSILADKQSRGAFGQGRMEAIVADALPANAYSFQATLASGARPDCLIHLPNGQAPLAIDAKFPLEGWTALGEAGTDEERRMAAARFRRDVLRHVLDIRDKYLVPGETQDTAFLFVPSESIFADLHERFDDLVQRAQRARVVIVSPSLLVLSIQVVQAILRDHRMREEADVIQAEVGLLAEDIARLHERVLKLAAHHGQAGRDLEQILISADKVQKRATRIENLDLSTGAALSQERSAPTVGRLAGE